MATTEKKLAIPIIFTKILWGIEHEFHGIRICGYKDFKNKIKPIFKAFCNQTKTHCKLNVTSEIHINNPYDRDEECYYLEAQIGVMIGFKYTLFEKCCDKFKDFIKCVSRINNTDKLYVLVDGEKKISEYKEEKNYKLKYYLGQDNVQKWPGSLLPKNILSKNLLITAPLEKIPEIINTKYEQTGKPQLTMSMSIAEFPLVFFMYFRIDFRLEIDIIYMVFIKSLTKTLLVFELEESIDDILRPFTLENFNSLGSSEFRDMLIECRDNILKATTNKYDTSTSKDFRLKWRSSDRLFGDLLSFWGFILYVNMYIKATDKFKKDYEDSCLLKDGNPQPKKTEKEFFAQNYLKLYFSLKNRTPIQYLYDKLSENLKDIICITPDCDLFEGCIEYKKVVTFKGKKLTIAPLTFTDIYGIIKQLNLSHDDAVFEFTEEQNLPYQITVEFRIYTDLLLSIRFSPSEYDTSDLSALLEESYTVDDLKKYTIAILEFYKPLFKNSLDPDAEEEKDEVLTENPIYPTSYKCSDPVSSITEHDHEPSKRKGCCDWLSGIFTTRFKSKKNKKSNLKSSPKKTKKSNLKSNPKKNKKSNLKSFSKKTKNRILNQSLKNKKI
jgi:hypothetical protein